MRALISLFFLLLASTTLTLDQRSFAADANTEEVTQELATIQKDIQWLEKELASKRAQLSQLTKEEAADLQQEISSLQLRIQRARVSFISTAANVDLPLPEVKTRAQKRDLIQEAQQFVEPFFDAIRRVSEKPRRIEAMKTRLAELTERRDQLITALNALDRTIVAKTYPQYETVLNESKENLTHERDELQVHINSITQSLKQEEGDRRTVLQVIQENTRHFIATKGWHLLVAAFAFFGVLWILFYLKGTIVRTQRSNTKFKRIERTFDAAYGTIAFSLSIGATIFTLHFLNDWFLASLIILVIIGFLWTFKSVIHHFVSEIRLALNLGTVKAGERVIWQGIPWFVKSLGFRSTLINENLEGGEITLPASILSGLLSREPSANEPWFPSRKGDYVLLDDGVYGQVMIQTPEAVVLDTGKTRKQYSVAAYLAKNPQNYSQGFTFSIELSLRSQQPQSNYLEMEKNFSPLLIEKFRSSAVQCLSQVKINTILLVPRGAQLFRVLIKGEAPGEIASQRDVIQEELSRITHHVWQELVKN